ncbi:hypothetical protein DFH06DRAFT_1151894 [Mycena polygramma]|nr:hypothetical protein DFH06DRAFT_1151894 [Mycena polygramma]
MGSARASGAGCGRAGYPVSYLYSEPSSSSPPLSPPLPLRRLATGIHPGADELDDVRVQEAHGGDDNAPVLVQVPGEASQGERGRPRAAEAAGKAHARRVAPRVRAGLDERKRERRTPGSAKSRQLSCTPLRPHRARAGGFMRWTKWKRGVDEGCAAKATARSSRRAVDGRDKSANRRGTGDDDASTAKCAPTQSSPQRAYTASHRVVTSARGRRTGVEACQSRTCGASARVAKASQLTEWRWASQREVKIGNSNLLDARSLLTGQHQDARVAPESTGTDDDHSRGGASEPGMRRSKPPREERPRERVTEKPKVRISPNHQWPEKAARSYSNRPLKRPVHLAITYVDGTKNTNLGAASCNRRLAHRKQLQSIPTASGNRYGNLWCSNPAITTEFHDGISHFSKCRKMGKGSIHLCLIRTRSLKTRSLNSQDTCSENLPGPTFPLRHTVMNRNGLISLDVAYCLPQTPGLLINTPTSASRCKSTLRSAEIFRLRLIQTYKNSLIIQQLRVSFIPNPTPPHFAVVCPIDTYRHWQYSCSVETSIPFHPARQIDFNWCIHPLKNYDMPLPRLFQF